MPCGLCRSCQTNMANVQTVWRNIHHSVTCRRWTPALLHHPGQCTAGACRKRRLPLCHSLGRRHVCIRCHCPRKGDAQYGRRTTGGLVMPCCRQHPHPCWNEKQKSCRHGTKTAKCSKDITERWYKKAWPRDSYLILWPWFQRWWPSRHMEQYPQSAGICRKQCSRQCSRLFQRPKQWSFWHWVWCHRTSENAQRAYLLRQKRPQWKW